MFLWNIARKFRCHNAEVSRSIDISESFTDDSHNIIGCGKPIFWLFHSFAQQPQVYFFRSISCFMVPPLRVDSPYSLQCTAWYSGRYERSNNLSAGNASRKPFTTAGNCDTVCHWLWDLDCTYRRLLAILADPFNIISPQLALLLP